MGGKDLDWTLQVCSSSNSPGKESGLHTGQDAVRGWIVHNGDS